MYILTWKRALRYVVKQTNNIVKKYVKYNVDYRSHFIQVLYMNIYIKCSRKMHNRLNTSSQGTKVNWDEGWEEKNYSGNLDIWILIPNPLLIHNMTLGNSCLLPGLQFPYLLKERLNMLFYQLYNSTLLQFNDLYLQWYLEA